MNKVVAKNKKILLGFTLIELLVVIAIIGILSTLAIVALSNARAKSRDSKRVADIKQISTALELYYADNSSYPTIITPGNSLVSPDGTKVYMDKIPSNPSPKNDGNCGNNDYTYSSTSDNNNYSLNFCLGNTTASTPSGINSTSNFGPNTAPGLIGWWKFDEGSGTTVIDSSGSAKSGTWGGVATHYGTSKVGAYSGTFPKDNVNYVSNNSGGFLPSGSSARTLIFWFKPNTGMTTANIAFSYGCNSVEGFNCSPLGVSKYFGAWASDANIGIHAQNCQLTGPAVPSPTTGWHFYSAVVNGDGTVTFYIDAGSATTANSAICQGGPMDTFAGSGFAIGSGTWGSYDGSIDDVRFYNRALSASEILAIYNATK